MILGLTGRMGAGKDTVCERLRLLLAPTEVERRAFADPLKNSACALLGVDRDYLERWKNEDHDAVIVVGDGMRGMTMRTFLQRYGTEAHRDIFGDDFWLNATLPSEHELPEESGLVVITDCRFPNEARRVKQCGGLVYEVVGPEGHMDTNAEHASERGLPWNLVDGYIDNRHRNGNFNALDAWLKNKLIPDLVGGG